MLLLLFICCRQTVVRRYLWGHVYCLIQRHGWLALAVCLLIPVAGCKPLEHSEREIMGLVFPDRRLQADSVALEIGLVQLDRSQTATFKRYWQLLDQQKLPIGMRQRLDQNGMRVAVMASHAPAELHQLQQSRPANLQKLSDVEKQMADNNLLQPEPRLILHQRIRNRSGESHSVSVSEEYPDFQWVVPNGSLRTVGQGQQVRGLMELKSLPQGDGTVLLRLTPEIHHGIRRPSIGVADRSFVLDTSQSVQRFNELTVGIRLRPGETAVVAPTEEVLHSDLGRLFFGLANVGNSATDSPVSSAKGSLAEPDSAPLESDLTHRFLMIRVVQTQLDDLFENSSVQEKLTTTSRR